MGGFGPAFIGKTVDVGQTGADNRLFLNAVFWVARHGCAWRAMPARFGKHDTLPAQTQQALGPKRHLAALVCGRAGTRLGLGDARLHRRAGPRASRGQPKKNVSATKPSVAAAAA
jgi:transposase